MDMFLSDCLIKWLQTFLEKDDITAESLTDGVALGSVLHQIAPEYFTAQWKSKILTNVGNNWRLKISNLRKVHQGIMDYFSELPGQTISQFPKPDLNKIGELGDELELGRLLQLILGCAIYCEQKQKHIEAIMEMEEGVQANIMSAIQDLMSRESSPGVLDATGGSVVQSTPWFGSTSFHPQIKKLVEQLESTSIAKDDMVRRCEDLDLQLSLLNEEIEMQKKENLALQERIDQLESGVEVRGQNSRYKEVRKQVDKLQDEMYKLESSREEYRSRVETLERENKEVMAKNEELHILADEARSLKDEVDALKDMSDRVAVYEGTVETLKKKMDELSDLKRQNKKLEEKNSEYMQLNMELEDEMKKCGMLRPQIDLYKKQVGDLHQKLTEEEKKIDRHAFENKKITEKLEAVMQEKERMVTERDTLKENLDELKCTVSALNLPDSFSGLNSELMDIDTLEIVSPEIREKLIRLQHENRLLKQTTGNSPDESAPMLQSLLNDLQERHDKLLQENREMHRQIMILESDMEDAKAFTTAISLPQTSSVVPKTPADDTNSAELEDTLSEQDEKIRSLEEQLQKKDSDMSTMEERYKRYLGKAKAVIKTLDPKHNPALMPDVAALRGQITEKNKIIEEMERECEKTKMFREMEEKLISTAFYNFGMQMQRHMINQRLSTMEQGQTFMNRQRQASARRGSQGQGASGTRFPSGFNQLEDMRYS